MIMKVQKMFSSFLLRFSILLILGSVVVQCDPHPIPFGTKRLFAIGDSYADTGNDRDPPSNSWMKPFGITFPGKPSGRFSDGRVFTDFLAKYLGLETPVAYHTSNVAGVAARQVRNGMNFAFGGTGVFETLVSYPNMTVQIDIFQGLINKSKLTPLDLHNAVVHVSCAGNDYLTYISRGGPVEGFPSLSQRVIGQLVVNLQRIYSLGVKKISVTTLLKLGCLPKYTFPVSYQQCNSTLNKVASYHDSLLKEAISKLLNNQISGTSSSPFIIVDLYKAFGYVIGAKGVPKEKLVFNKPLTPCCNGINEKYVCGSVDTKGNKLYTLCENRSSSFFWDAVHPTQAGYEALIHYLQPTLLQFRY